eukprot:m51a1_g7387 hypothetical protein (694) ;mRNA; f:121295-124427
MDGLPPLYPQVQGPQAASFPRQVPPPPVPSRSTSAAAVFQYGSLPQYFPSAPPVPGSPARAPAPPARSSAKGSLKGSSKHSRGDPALTPLEVPRANVNLSVSDMDVPSLVQSPELARDDESAPLVARGVGSVGPGGGPRDPRKWDRLPMFLFIAGFFTVVAWFAGSLYACGHKRHPLTRRWGRMNLTMCVFVVSLLFVMLLVQICIYAILLPAVLSNYSSLGLTLINLAFVGRLGATPMAACVLSTTIFNIAGQSGAQGISCALDTLCSQAHGARNPLAASHALQRVLVSVTAFAAPVVALLFFIEPVLRALGQDEDVSRIAGGFLRILIAGMLPSFWNEAIRRALYAAGVSWPQLVVCLIGVVSITALDWVFIRTCGFGVNGSAAALSCTWALQFVMFVAIIRASGFHRTVLAGGPSLGALKTGWVEMLKLVASGYVMICSEWWAFEICVFLAGLGGAVSLASFSIVMTIQQFCWMLPLSVSITASARVGFLLGANDPVRARFSAWLCVAAIGVLEFLYIPPLVLFGRYFAMVFSSDPDVVAAASSLIPFGAFVLVQDDFNAVFSGVLRGCGMQLFGAVCNVIFFYIVCIPVGCLLLFVAKIGTKALFFGLAVGIFGMSSTFCVRVVTLKWKEIAAAAHLRQSRASKSGDAEEGSSKDVEEIPLNGAPASDVEAEGDLGDGRTSRPLTEETA